MKVSFDQATKVIASFDPAMFCVGLLPIAIAVGETFPTPPGSAKPNQVAFERISFAMPERCDQALALDIDADGDKDIVGLCQTKIVGITMPERSVETLFAANSGQTIHGQAWDADGDGDEDILFCRFTPGSPPNDDSVAWLEMPSQTLHVLDRDIRGVHGVAIGDLDGDGRQDVVTANVKGPQFPLSVAWFDGRTQRRRFICKSGAGPRPHYPVVADIDGDGRNDVVLGDGGGFSLFRNPGPERIDSNWPKTRIAAVAGGTNVCTADFDGDGKLDILGSCGHGKGIRWYQNPSWKSHRVDDSIANAHALDCKDLDDDGDIDIVSGAFGGYGPEQQRQRLVRVYLNDGSGNFDTLDIDTAHKQESYSASIVDVDDDGNEDVLLAGRGSNNVVWYRQVGENHVTLLPEELREQGYACYTTRKWHLCKVNLQAALQDREFHFEHEGRRALIHGKWKAIWPTPQGPWELYDLSIDRTERNNLARKFPERLRQLTDRWHELAAKYQVHDYFPAPWAEPTTQTSKANQ